MQEKIHEIEKKISLIENDVASLKSNYSKMETIEKEVHSIKNTVIKMEMIDENIFDKLNLIVEALNSHKDNFSNHDDKEMEKYGEIDKRLLKIEKILYMFMGGFILIETLHKFKLVSFGG